MFYITNEKIIYDSNINHIIILRAYTEIGIYNTYTYIELLFLPIYIDYSIHRSIIIIQSPSI